MEKLGTADVHAAYCYAHETFRGLCVCLTAGPIEMLIGRKRLALAQATTHSL